MPLAVLLSAILLPHTTPSIAIKGPMQTQIVTVDEPP
jgi:hypothetical protein